jgi:hypothetical protein
MPGYHFCRNESETYRFINSTASELDMALQINVQRGDVFDWLKKFRNKNL